MQFLRTATRVFSATQPLAAVQGSSNSNKAVVTETTTTTIRSDQNNRFIHSTTSQQKTTVVDHRQQIHSISIRSCIQVDIMHLYICRYAGYFKKFLFPTERQLRTEQLHENGIFPGNPAFDAFYDKLEQTQVSKDLNIPDALLDDPLLHVSVIKYNKHVVEKYNLSPEQEKSLLEEYDLSYGDSSLEYILPLPVPEHNFEELPVIVRYDGEH
ncbi:cytochrome c oxidase subunit IV [Cavenderia fasciculata]|uniref:Cytochrome c oxidase subunit IV n=1 Tax=Cavenderia fasciculata TaxID=261658 RepID=F4QFN1_CACFS|nr:cytochrome c oxidase subunit IV [Cavenderia fasciculata]EGG13484.1 cytochrome c oxidase subunit IV [Cavenderia fasciculata]|eukprot:XP_004350188.1 cytochrome c oxidase subunit IV [Cavenderia fasciculata]